MSSYNRFSDKAIRSKKLEDMNEAEMALFKIQAGQAFESVKAKFPDEPNMMMALSKLLREEAGRQIYADQPKETTKSNDLFGGEDR